MILKHSSAAITGARAVGGEEWGVDHIKVLQDGSHHRNQHSAGEAGLWELPCQLLRGPVAPNGQNSCERLRNQVHGSELCADVLQPEARTQRWYFNMRIELKESKVEQDSMTSGTTHSCSRASLVLVSVKARADRELGPCHELSSKVSALPLWNTKESLGLEYG